MKRWSVGVNNYYYTSCIGLEEAPWYAFFIDWLTSWICYYFPRIPLPNFIKIKRDGEIYGLKDYYGTTADLFHVFICTLVSNWSWSKTKWYSIDFPYEELMKMFPEDFKDDTYDDEDEDEKRERNINYEYSRKIGKIFMISYNNLHNISGLRMKEIKEEETNEDKR